MKINSSLQERCKRPENVSSKGLLRPECDCENSASDSQLAVEKAQATSEGQQVPSAEQAENCRASNGAEKEQGSGGASPRRPDLRLRAMFEISRLLLSLEVKQASKKFQIAEFEIPVACSKLQVRTRRRQTGQGRGPYRRRCRRAAHQTTRGRGMLTVACCPHFPPCTAPRSGSCSPGRTQTRRGPTPHSWCPSG